MKILSFILILSSFFFYGITNAEDNTSTYSQKKGYELYKQRVQNICKKYKYNPTIVELKDDYPEITKENTYSFKDTQELHRKNMNLIYKCGLISTQKKSLLLIKNSLLNVSVSKKIEGQISNNIEKLKTLADHFGCKETNDKDSIQKLILLKQATYQTCKYISYLEYLKEYNKDINNIVDTRQGHYTPLKIVKTQKEKLGELNTEIQHTYKIFPLVFHAYTEYENNITIHFLLSLLKDDYITFREKLHKTLNPINQFVYKVINAMKK